MSTRPPLAAPGPQAAGPDAPPLAPAAFAALLARRPTRAAAILAAFRPALRSAQARAHAAHTGHPLAAVLTDWADLAATAAPTPSADAPASAAAVYEPADLLADPDQLAARLAALTPTQRVQQALAVAAWRSQHGPPLSLDAVLAAWGEPPPQRRAG